MIFVKPKMSERNLKAVRNRYNPLKKWSRSEEISLINYIKQNPDFEKPTGRIYYTKFLSTTQIGIDWKLVRSKVRNMRVTYRKAKEYEINKNYFNSSGFNTVRNKVLKKCWFVDHFDVLFPNEIDNYINKKPENNKTDKSFSDEEEKEEDELSSNSSSSNSIDRPILRVQKDMCSFKQKRRKTYTSIKEQELELAREKLAFDKEKFRQELRIKEMEIASQEKTMLMELQMKERIATKELELKEKLALDSLENEESSYNNDYHNLTQYSSPIVAFTAFHIPIKSKFHKMTRYRFHLDGCRNMPICKISNLATLKEKKYNYKNKRQQRTIPKKWDHNDEAAIINFLKQNREFEKPTQRIFYTKFIMENGLEDIHWKLVYYKVRNMRTVYRRAKEYQKQRESVNEMDAEAVKNVMLKICWYVEEFDVLFPNEMSEHKRTDVEITNSDKEDETSKQEFFSNTTNHINNIATTTFNEQINPEEPVMTYLPRSIKKDILAVQTGIIKCITLTTLYMNSMWWPPNKSFGGFLNQAIFLMLSSVATFNYIMATLTGPGILPKNWKPQEPQAVEQLQYCKVCEGYKAPRSHHCRNRCIKKMDHHCPWINHCVGWANHAYFTYFLAFSIIGSLHGAVILCITFYRGIHRYWYLSRGLVHLATVQFSMYSIILCIFSMGLAIGVVIALGMLLYFQLKSIVKNQTGIEMWIVEKAMYRRMHNPDLDDFVYPYDLGWWSNIKQVFVNDNVTKGAGIEWPVKEGCHQYTLTCEQIAQKCEKRARTRTYKCIRKATGSYLPLFSQGFRVCLSPPCTDEPRLRLEPDDIIKVTRFRQHWLFGERVVDDRKEKDIKKPLRGWFPRRCAVELIQPEQPYSSGEDCEVNETNYRHQQTPKKVTLNNGASCAKSQNGHHRKKNN
ncbi:Palmitoyltransferase ZDHHC6 [Lucilia cuprina]|nr:Palmitoyltransferase ZDHHC6 [Lucilia cuprina]